MNGKEGLYEMYRSCLIKGVHYILAEHICGWPAYVNQKDPEPWPTGHVLFFLDYLGLRRFKAINESIIFMENNAEKINGKIQWRMTQKGGIFGPELSLSATILGITSLSLGSAMRFSSRYTEDDLLSSLDYCIDLYTDKNNNDNSGLWEFFMLSFLSEKFKVLDKYEERLLERFYFFWDDNKKMIINIASKDYSGDAAKGILGLFCHKNSTADPLIRKLLKFIIDNKVEDTTGIHWSPGFQKNLERGIGPFFVSRWVVLALSRCFKNNHFNDLEMLEKATRWLIKHQSPDGSWRERKKDNVGPSFCAYANMAIREYLSAVYPTKEKDTNKELHLLQLRINQNDRICFRTKSKCTENAIPNLNKIFVLMPFTEDFDDVFDTLQELFVRDDYKVERADTKIENVDIVCKKICRKIQQSGLIIADISKQNPNVFYEIGLAHGMGRDVWLISKEKDNYPFDVKTLHILHYTNMLSLKKHLKSTILPYLESKT